MNEMKNNKIDRNGDCGKEDSKKPGNEKIISLLGLEQEYKDPEKAAILEKLLETRMDKLIDTFTDLHMVIWYTYMGTIAKFSKITSDYTNEYVQAIVDLIYQDYCGLIRSKGMKEAFTNKVYMVGGMILPLEGEPSLCQKLCKEYGEQAIDFVVMAMMHFSGCDPEDEVWERLIMSTLGSLNMNRVS